MLKLNATAHGKSGADGIGGTVQRTAAKASLQRPIDDQILTPIQLYQFVSSEIKGIHFDFATSADHKEEKRFLKERYKYCRTVPGTRSLHCVIPITVEVRQFSLSQVKRIERVCTAAAAHYEETHPLSSIKDYVTVAYDGCCWLGCVVKVDMEARVGENNFLHPQLPSNLYGYPQHQDVMEVDPLDILTLVSPLTATGRRYMYYLTAKAKEVAAATCALEAKA